MSNRNSYKYYGIDFVGQRHERLLVIEKTNRGRSWLKCKCDCGNEVELPIYKFLEYKSCGCLEKENKENLGKNNRTHNMTKTRLYSVWCGMKDRCFNPNTEHYDRYGGRGITMCSEWKNSFESFMKWAYENGYDETITGKEQSIDRTDPNGNYEPSNCRWVSFKEQSRNKVGTIYLKYKGEKISASLFQEISGIPDHTYIHRKIKKGLIGEEIIKEWNMVHNTPDYLLTIKEAAEYYGVCELTIRNWIKANTIKYEKSGYRLFVYKNENQKQNII